LEEGSAFSQALIRQRTLSSGLLSLWRQIISYVCLRVARKVWATRDLLCGHSGDIRLASYAMIYAGFALQTMIYALRRMRNDIFLRDMIYALRAHDD